MSYLGYLIGTAFLFWAIMPLFMKDRTWISIYMETEELEDQKRRVYGNIADLEFDYAMGRLSDNDFNSIRQSFLGEAGRVIEKLENERSSDLSIRIIGDAKSSGKHKKKKKKSNACPHCKTNNSLEAKFCMKCGKELS